MPTVSRGGRIQALEGGLEELEKSYGMEQGAMEEEEGSGGFLQNFISFYEDQEWGDWWRGLFGKEVKRREPSGYTMYPEWGEENIRNLRSIMEE